MVLLFLLLLILIFLISKNENLIGRRIDFKKGNETLEIKTLAPNDGRTWRLPVTTRNKRVKPGILAQSIDISDLITNSNNASTASFDCRVGATDYMSYNNAGLDNDKNVLLYARGSDGHKCYLFLGEEYNEDMEEDGSSGSINQFYPWIHNTI